MGHQPTPILREKIQKREKMIQMMTRKEDRLLALERDKANENEAVHPNTYVINKKPIKLVAPMERIQRVLAVTHMISMMIMETILVVVRVKMQQVEMKNNQSQRKRMNGS